MTIEFQLTEQYFAVVLFGFHWYFSEFILDLTFLTLITFPLYFLQIRLQYEEYPEDTEQASRLVVLVQDVEIRDRLAHSQINKFLYQYTSEACPKQSHANMVRNLDNTSLP